MKRLIFLTFALTVVFTSSALAQTPQTGAESPPPGSAGQSQYVPPDVPSIQESIEKGIEEAVEDAETGTAAEGAEAYIEALSPTEARAEEAPETPEVSEAEGSGDASSHAEGSDAEGSDAEGSEAEGSGAEDSEAGGSSERSISERYGITELPDTGGPALLFPVVGAFFVALVGGFLLRRD